MKSMRNTAASKSALFSVVHPAGNSRLKESASVRFFGNEQDTHGDVGYIVLGKIETLSLGRVAAILPRRVEGSEYA